MACELGCSVHALRDGVHEEPAFAEFASVSGWHVRDLTPKLMLVVAVLRRAVVDYYSFGPNTSENRCATQRWFRRRSFEPWGFAWVSEVPAPDDAKGMRTRVPAMADRERDRRRALASRKVTRYDGMHDITKT